MVVAVNLSVKRSLLSSQDAEKIKVLLARLELPVMLEMDRERMIDAIKKRQEKRGGLY